jgi:hypothetical protein
VHKKSGDDDMKKARDVLTAGGDDVQNFDLKVFGNVLGGDKPNIEAKKTLIAWHLVVHDLKAESLDKYLRDRVVKDCIFSPPTYFTPWKGRDELLVILQSVGEVFGESFTYGRQWVSPDCREWALEFTADIADTGKKIEGIDMVSLNEEGKITDFKVLARPPNAVSALKDQMMKKVPPKMALMKAKQAMSSIFGK